MTDNFKTRLKKVKGLGAAHSGVSNWLALRVSAIALIPLTAWLIFSILHLVSADYAHVILWLKNPLTTFLILLLVPFTFYHSYGGMKEVIEDYIHCEFSKITILILMKLFFISLTVADVFAALYINFKL